VADWSSIWAGFGIVWAGLIVYAGFTLLRLRRVGSEQRPASEAPAQPDRTGMES